MATTPQMTGTTLVDLRKTVRHAGINCLHATGKLKRAKQQAAQRGVIVLTLHRVIPDGQIHACRSPRGMVLRESLFAKLVDYLRAETTCVSPETIASKGSIEPRPRILITFDDGWLDNAVVAWPYLQRARAQAVIFLTTGSMGHAHPFWPERFLGVWRQAGADRRTQGIQELLMALGASAFPGGFRGQLLPASRAGHEDTESVLSWLKTIPTDLLLPWIDRLETSASSTCALHDRFERLLDWNQVRDLSSQGLSFGSHTVSHSILPNASEVQLRYELEASRRELTANVKDMAWIAYPNGGVSSGVADAARDAGYRYGFCNSPGIWSQSTDALRIPRVNIWDGTLTDQHGNFCVKHLEYALFWTSTRATHMQRWHARPAKELP